MDVTYLSLEAEYFRHLIIIPTNQWPDLGYGTMTLNLLSWLEVVLPW